MNHEKVEQLFPLFSNIDQVKHLLHSDDHDLRYSALFLYSYRGSPDTFKSYRREVERLLQWSKWVVHIDLVQLTRQDVEAFVDFCESPPASWVSTKQVARFKKTGEVNSEWRPFVSRTSTFTLSQPALQAIFSVLSSFFNFLIQEEVIHANPVQQIRQKSKYFRKKASKQQVRRLSALQWQYVIETAERLAKTDPQHERTLFIMSALFGMFLRISELVATPRWQPSMSDFKRDQEGHWWFTTVGKGNKERQISVSNDMLNALKRYRLALGLSSLPTPTETTPLINKQRGQGPVTSTRQIRLIVQHCFDQAILQLQQDGLSEEADQLKAATVHWLRHTGISEDVKHRPREHVRDDAGHGSSAITDRYIDIELRARHASARKKSLKPLGDGSDETN